MKHIYEELKELLEDYFTGDLDRKIKIFKRKAREKYPDDYYDTTGGINLTQMNTISEGWHSDPTGNRAVYLADLREERRKEYKRYSTIKKAIEGAIIAFSYEEITIIKAEIGIIEWNKTGLDYEKAKKKAENLLSIISNEVKKAKRNLFYDLINHRN